MWPDNETTLDLLGFEVHADLIRSVVTAPNLLPITIGVFGDWGGGKTSVMKMLERDLDPNGYEDGQPEKESAKAFSGAVALSLVSKGTLSLDDTIGERLPELSVKSPTWSKVTLRQLLNHTSGLPDFSEDPAFKAAVGESFTKAPPPEKLLTYVYGQPLQFTSGSEYRYSNSDNIAVALMVEEATGKTYENQL